VRLDEPGWWYRPAGFLSTLLAPAAWAYGRAAIHRFRNGAGYRSSLPVICIGNLTAGGAGKTPFAMYLIGVLRQLGEHPAVLSRGYGGRLAGPHLVTAGDRAGDVGDEPLLLARHAPTFVARDRAQGARAIERHAAELRDATVIVMDDGLQNPALHKDLVIAVVDGKRGIGNGRTIPAGPLRAPLSFQLPLLDLVVLNRAETDEGPGLDWPWLATCSAPVLPMQTGTSDGAKALFGGRAVVAFAGIGEPRKFFATLAALGADVRDRIAFPDHHPFTEADANRLLGLAARHHAELITTEKDYARLEGAETGPLLALQQRTRTLPLRVWMRDEDAQRLTTLMREKLDAARRQ